MTFRLRSHLLVLTLGSGSFVASEAHSVLAQTAAAPAPKPNAPVPAAPPAAAAPTPPAAPPTPPAAPPTRPAAAAPTPSAAAAPTPPATAAPTRPVASAPVAPPADAAAPAPSAATPQPTAIDANAPPLPSAAASQAPPAGQGPAAGEAPASDATTTAEPESDLGTVTVTAQRRENTVQKTPIAITAFGEDAIAQKKIADFRDLSGRVPGLTLPLRSTAYTTQVFSIRGIGEIDTYPEPSVALYVDDVYIARSVGSIYDTPDLERVEVLRGPQGTLYGRNSAAGAIRFITKDPKAERTAGLSLTLGNYNNVLIKGRLSGGILPDDKLNASVSVVRHERRGWTYSVPLARWVNDLDIWALRGKVKSQLTDRFSATLAGDIMFDRSTASYYTPVYQPNGNPTSKPPTNPDLTWSNTIPLNKTTVYGGSLTFKYGLDDNLSLKSVTAVRGMHGPIYYDNDGVTQIKGDSYAGFNQNYETQEFTINGDYDKLNFVGGLFYFNEFFHNNRLSQAASGMVDNVGVQTHANSYLKTQSYAAFANADYKLTKALSVTGGLRYTLDHRGFANDGQVQTGANLIYPLPGNNDPSQFSSLFDPKGNFYARPPARNYSALTPKLGVNEQLTEDVLVYASYSRGFKSGGYDLRATSSAASTTPYKPQYTNAYEAGWKSSFFDNRFTANVAAFYNQITDLQVRAISGGSTGIGVML